MHCAESLEGRHLLILILIPPPQLAEQEPERIQLLHTANARRTSRHWHVTRFNVIKSI